jgi:hypothetical protein
MWRTATRNGWLRLGVFLFCLGMGLTGATLLEQGLWALLGLVVLYNWWRSRPDTPARRTPQVPLPSVEATNSTLDNTRSRISAVAEWLIKRELLLLALLSPFFIFPAPDRAWVLAALPLLWIVRRIARGHFIPRTPLDWPILILMAMVPVSLYATFSVAVSLQRIALLLFGVGIFYAIIEWASSLARLKFATWAYVLAGVGLAVVGLLGSEWGNKLPIIGALAAQLPDVLKGALGEEGAFNPTISPSIQSLRKDRRSVPRWSIVHPSQAQDPLSIVLHSLLATRYSPLGSCAWGWRERSSSPQPSSSLPNREAPSSVCAWV